MVLPATPRAAGSHGKGGSPSSRHQCQPQRPKPAPESVGRCDPLERLHRIIIQLELRGREVLAQMPDARRPGDPATGNCCAYRNRTAAPNGWLRFDSEADCKTRCLCSALEGFEGAFEDLVYVPDSLECHCSRVSCPSTLEEAEQTLCSVTIPPAAVQRLVGCGMVVVRDRNGSSGYEWVFEQTSEAGDAAAPASRLVGASEFSDASSTDACTTSSWSSGRDFFEECDAAEVVRCQLCGDSPGPEYSPCQ